jgi:hypothetical protein
MDKKLTPQEFSDIFVNSFPNSVYNLQQKAFEYCIKDLDFPYLNIEEKDCIKFFTSKYLSSIDYTLINFSQKVL